MRKPILLEKEKLLIPIRQAIQRLEKIRERKEANEDEIILEGLFVLAVSTFENSLSDTLRILYTHFPEKISFKSKKVDKESLLEGTVLPDLIEKHVIELSYGSIKSIINKFTTSTGINIDGLENISLDHLSEIKASRNLLLHNNLVVNSQYKEEASSFDRSNRIGEKLNIDQGYLFESITLLKDILREFKYALEEKYQNYTRLKASKELFNFLLPTPIIGFENEFEVDQEEDKIIAYKEEESQKGNLSHSESVIFEFWLAHLQGRQVDSRMLNFVHLGPAVRERIKFLISKIDLLLEQRFST